MPARAGDQRPAAEHHGDVVNQEGRRGKMEGESALLAKLAEMLEPDRAMAGHLHAIIKARECPQAGMRP